MTTIETTINGEYWKITVGDGLIIDISSRHLTVLRSEEPKAGRVSRPFDIRPITYIHRVDGQNGR